jgi:hypothetical protein
MCNQYALPNGRDTYRLAAYFREAGSPPVLLSSRNAEPSLSRAVYLFLHSHEIAKREERDDETGLEGALRILNFRMTNFA